MTGAARDLEWDGCRNVRDLGGLPLVGGGTTAFGRVVRSDNPARLSRAGWSALRAAGVRTVLLLRTHGITDDEPDASLVPSDVAIARVEIEDATDPAFRRRCIDTDFWLSPLEWGEMLRWWPERCATAMARISQVGEGSVLVSCGIGRDRTGLVAFLLQALVGVTPEAIAEDWRRSLARLAGDPTVRPPSPVDVLEHAGLTLEEAVASALALDVAARLLAGGLTQPEIEALRRRLAG